MERWFLVMALLFATSCSSRSSVSQPPEPPRAQLPGQSQCELIPSENGFGSQGTVAIRADKVVTGLEVPWGIGFLPGGDFLVTERPGRIRIVRGGALAAEPVATVDVSENAESGLLGIAIDPEFASNDFFYVYYTSSSDVNRVQRYILSSDRRHATPDLILLDQIPAGAFHDGGRLRFGPDGMLYVGTGDATNPQLAQQLSSPSGKVLRITRDGAIPGDNPHEGNPAYLLGIRNTQGFDWLPGGLMVVADHGPSGELGRLGHDELNFAQAGANLGWPVVWRCDVQPGFLTPAMVWERALPPGGALFYTGNAIPGWKGSILIATLGSEHLQRVMITLGNVPAISGHEVYLSDQFGRLRDIVQSPDGSVFVTTSNCDGRGTCGREKDVILRVTGVN